MFKLIEMILPILLMIFGILAILLSRSDFNRKKLVQSWGNDFAEETSKKMNSGGYIVVALSSLWIAFNLVLD